MSRPINHADLAVGVTTIRVTVHTTGKFFEGDTCSGNHASIYLILADGSGSIRLNMIKAGPTDTKGTFQTTHCGYTESNSTLHHFDIKAHDGLKVKDALALVEGNRRDKYELARSGVGCRFWCQTVIKDFEHKGFIDRHSPVNVASVVEGLRYNYSRGKTPEFEEVVPGKFH